MLINFLITFKKQFRLLLKAIKGVIVYDIAKNVDAKMTSFDLT